MTAATAARAPAIAMTLRGRRKARDERKENIGSAARQRGAILIDPAPHVASERIHLRFAHDREVVTGQGHDLHSTARDVAPAECRIGGSGERPTRGASELEHAAVR